MSERDRPIKRCGSGSFVQMVLHSPMLIYKEGTSRRFGPVVGQLDGGLGLSPQRLRSDKALEVKRLFPRKHVVHGAAQLVREHGQRFGFAVFVFEFRKIRFPRLTLADEEHGSFGKRPT